MGKLSERIKKIKRQLVKYKDNKEIKKSLRKEIPFFHDTSFKIFFANTIVLIIIVPLNIYIYSHYVRNTDKELFYYSILNIISFLIYKFAFYKILNIQLIDRLFGLAIKIKDVSIGLLTYNSHTGCRDALSFIKTKLSIFFDIIRQIISRIIEKIGSLQKTGENLSTEMENTIVAVNKMNHSVDSTKNQIVSQFESIKKVTDVVDHLIVNVERLDKTIKVQSSNIEESSSSIEIMIRDIGAVMRITESAKLTVNDLGKLSNDGKMKVTAVNEAVKEITQYSNMLREANKVITNITVQINMLSINASIEAAHADIKDSGFAVVADKIGNLAKMSSKEIKSIKNVLDSIMKLINTIADDSAKVDKAFVMISDLIEKAIMLVEDIRNSVFKQNTEGKQILDSLISMKYVTEQVRGGSHEMLDGNKEIMVQITNLNEMSNKIQLAVGEINNRIDDINKTVSNVKDIVQDNKNNINDISNEIARLKFEEQSK